MMKRDFEKVLLNWKLNKNKKPLLIQGARQVGKTYIVRKFARENYKNVVYLNFEENKSLNDIFINDLNPDRIVAVIGVLYDVEVNEDTVFIFDEVQASERAITSLKYFEESDNLYNVIATGSMLGIYMNREEFSFPVGKVQLETMRPMTFKEFLIAKGKSSIIKMIESSYKKNEYFPLHDMALGLYREYLLVGGMPEAVYTYISTNDLDKVRQVQNLINNSYIADMQKYASNEDSTKLYDIFKSIPVHLGKDNKKFKYSVIKSGARAKDYAYPIHWLEMSGIINKLERISEGSIPIAAYREPSFFKVYLSDVGLFSRMINMPYEKVLVDDKILGIYKGTLAELYVLEELVASGVEPYYWNPNQNTELDFVYQSSQGEIIPIEVKSGQRTRSKSLDKFMKKYGAEAIRLSTKNFGYEDGIKSVPLYATWCIR